MLLTNSLDLIFFLPIVFSQMRFAKQLFLVDRLLWIAYVAHPDFSLFYVTLFVNKLPLV